MKVKIRNINGKKRLLEVDGDDTILHLLMLANPERAFATELLYQGRKLEKFCTVAYYRIGDGDHLQVIDSPCEACPQDPHGCNTG